MRCFIALVPDATSRAALARVQALIPSTYPAFRPVRPEGLHLTLVFHGGLDESGLEASKVALRSLRPGLPLSLRFTHLLALPRRGAARVLALGAARDEGEDQAAALRLRLSLALEREAQARGLAGLDPEAGRRLRAHLSLARCKGRGAPVDPEALRAAIARDLQAPTRFDACVLYASSPARDGSIYEALETLSLSGGNEYPAEPLRYTHA